MHEFSLVLFWIFNYTTLILHYSLVIISQHNATL